MPHELHPEIIAPAHPHVARLLAAGVGCAVVSAGLMVALQPSRAAQLAPAPLAITETLTLPMSVPVVARTEAPPPRSSRKIALVFQAGGAPYVELASLGDDPHDAAMPRHGTPKRVEDGAVSSTVARVAPEDLSRSQRAWLGKPVSVDGTCTAKVTGFAVISRLTGSPAYAGEEGGSDDTWTASAVSAHGAEVLAARLDGCASGVYARDAASAPIVVPQVIDDPTLAATATSLLQASADTAAAQQEWQEAEMEGVWYRNQDATTTAQVLRHPRTGVTWVSVHLAYDGSCGLPQLGVWGLYKVGASGAMTRVKSSLGELIQIEQLVDVDGDGQLEVIGHPWLGTERAVQTTDGATLDQLDLPFFGCPC